jgi:hypothetical protein
LVVEAAAAEKAIKMRFTLSLTRIVHHACVLPAADLPVRLMKMANHFMTGILH